MRPDVLGQLLDDHAAALVLYARQWCASAEDVVQEAFVKLASQRPEPDNCLAWLYRVVRNGALTAARSDRRRRFHESYAAAHTPTWFVPAEGTSLDAETATAALEDLPIEQREPLVAHLWGGLTFEQVGDLVGVSSSTAHRRYLTALATLRERLRVPCPTPTSPTDAFRRRTTRS
jgi:RNA polymerase sigma-70 factor (ECF subfamily)